MARSVIDRSRRMDVSGSARSIFIRRVHVSRGFIVNAKPEDTDKPFLAKLTSPKLAGRHAGQLCNFEGSDWRTHFRKHNRVDSGKRPRRWYWGRPE
jgi:hypothetical protein